MSGDHSGVEPPLPFPNRTVKRSSADDSVHLARESRSSPDSHTKSPPIGGLFIFRDGLLSDYNARVKSLAYDHES